MRVIELLIDEDELLSGIEAISIVDRPAIQEHFIALSEQSKLQLAEVDKEKRILMGAALVPNKNIYRQDGEDEYYIYFSEDTVRKASELFLMRGNQNKSTLEHEAQLNGLSVVESWIIEDEKYDKSRKYDMDLPVGTWMVSMKVNNDEVWNNYVKTGLVKGFSIEGYFTDKVNMAEIESVSEDEANEILLELRDYLNSKMYKLATYNDYPDGVVSNAKRVLEYVDKNGWGSCGTAVGKRRASQLASKANLTVSTIKRMHSFLARHESDLESSKSYSDGCGKLMYDAWGGKAGFRWAKSKLKEIGELDLASQVIDNDFAIIDDRLAYSTKEKAEEMAKNIGCEGFHTHEFKGKTWYMPCKTHIKDEIKLQKCPKGFVKNKVGKCVKRKSSYAEVGERGGIRKSPKAPASGTPNKNPKGKGTAKGNAKGKTGAKVSAKDRASLQKKADEFNKKYKDKLGYGVTVGVLSSVFQRGLGAFNTSHSPRVKSPSQWAHARVNAYMYLVKNGRPQNPKYTTDYDLLPKKHPKSKK
tara:strand:- start:1006 stop:2589 length:1584 start_codon:yes stop_codon:yes gene_type:complete